MNRQGRRHPGGFVLGEMLMAIVLIAIFMTAITQLFRATLRIPYRANEADGLATRFDGAVGQLRRDVWGSLSVVADGQDGRSIRIERAGTNGDITAVTWKVDEAGMLTRTGILEAGQPPMTQMWPDVAKGMAFQFDGPVLLFVEPASASSDGRQIPLVSAIATSRGGRAS